MSCAAHIGWLAFSGTMLVVGLNVGDAGPARAQVASRELGVTPAPPLPVIAREAFPCPRVREYVEMCKVRRRMEQIKKQEKTT